MTGGFQSVQPVQAIQPLHDFGKIDLDLDEVGVDADERLGLDGRPATGVGTGTRTGRPASGVPSLQTRPPASGPSLHTRTTRRAFEAVQAAPAERPSMRVEASAGVRVRSDSEVVPSAKPARRARPVDEDISSASPSSATGSVSSAPSASRIAARDGRVAAMRELYASGDVDGALAVAADIASAPPPPDSGTYDRAFGDFAVASRAGDPFGGLIPLDAREPQDDWGTAISDVSAQIAAVVSDGLRAVADLRVPRVRKTRAELSKLPIDHRAGFLLAHIDGMQTMEEILDVCAMPEQEALELIAQLEAMGVISIG